MEQLYQILLFVFGGSGIFSSIAWWRQTKRIKDAEAIKAKSEAEKTEAEAREAEDDRFDRLLELVDSLTSRLSSLNDAVDKHIDRNRELSDRLYKSETELNRANDRIIKLTESRDAERSLKEHFKLWHCRMGNCANRLPPNEKLKGLKYEPPQKTTKQTRNN